MDTYLLLSLSISFCTSEVTNPPSYHMLNAFDKNYILKMHNRIRLTVSNGNSKDQPSGIIGPLKWDRNLENFAIKTFAKFIDESSRCPGNDDLRGQGTCWFHNQTVDSVGFNVFQTSNWNFVKGSLFHWYHRHVGYVYGKYTIGQEKNADSYTQMVWARTKKIGCAIGTGCIVKDKPYKVTLLCYYWPPGNVIDEYPYYNETTPKDWEKYKHHLVDECQIEQYKIGNWDRRNGKLKREVLTSYPNVDNTSIADDNLYKEIVKDDLNELICNIIKNQDIEELKVYQLESLHDQCHKRNLGHRPIREKLQAIEIAIKVCEETKRLENAVDNKNMREYCESNRLYQL